jgi:hypothetical protein
MAEPTQLVAPGATTRDRVGCRGDRADTYEDKDIRDHDG